MPDWNSIMQNLSGRLQMTARRLRAAAWCSAAYLLQYSLCHCRSSRTVNSAECSAARVDDPCHTQTHTRGVLIRQTSREYCSNQTALSRFGGDGEGRPARIAPVRDSSDVRIQPSHQLRRTWPTESADRLFRHSPRIHEH